MTGLESLVISSLDIPDAPAKAVIAKNNNARALRLAEETRQELTEISDRVELVNKNLIDFNYIYLIILYLKIVFILYKLIFLRCFRPCTTMNLNMKPAMTD